MNKRYRWVLSGLSCGALVGACGFPEPPPSGGGTGGAATSGSSTTLSGGGEGGSGGGGGGGGGGGSECTSGDTESCYDGPQGTQVGGECRPGTRTCAPNGTWGPCEDQVLPQTEDPSKDGDENCDGWTGACQWQKPFGDSGLQHTDQISVVGDTGASFIAGSFDGTLDFSDGLGPQSGDGYVAKLDTDGNGSWSKTFGGGVRGYNLAAYPGGGVVLVGILNGVPMDFGGGALDPEGNYSGFAARYDADGNHIWSLLGKSSDWGTQILAVAAGLGGEIVVGIGCGGSSEIGGMTMECGPGTSFVAKLDPLSGEASWITPSFAVSESSKLDTITSLAIDDNGDVFASGSQIGVVDFGVATLGTPGVWTGFVLKLNGLDGTVVWAQSLGPMKQAFNRTDIALDPDGDPVVVMNLNGDHDFGNGCPLAIGVQGLDVAVVKLDKSNGTCSWLRHFPAPGDQRTMAVAVGGDGSVAVGGAFEASVDFGDGEHVLKGTTDAFLLKLDKNGEPGWSRAFGDADDDIAPEIVFGVGMDAAGYIYAAGDFDGNVPFCDGLGMAGGMYANLFVAKYAP